MSNINDIRSELTKYAQQIENLARQVQDHVAKGNDPMMAANELVRNNSTLIFVLGEMYALEQNSGGKKVKATTVSNPNGTATRNYHNVRDALGRFTRV